MRSCKQGESRARDPQVCLCMGDGTPGERPIGLCLIEAVNFERIVSAGAAECIPLAAGTDVAEGSGIDQPGAAAESQFDAQCVRVAVPAASSALRACVDDQLLGKGLGVSRNVKSAIWEGLRFRSER